MATGRTIEVVAKLRDSISPTLTKVSGKLKIFGQKAKAVFQSIKGAVFGLKGALLGMAAVIGGAIFINAMKKVVEIGIEQEEAFATLQGTLRKFGDEAKAVTGRLADYSAELQQMTVHGDEAIMAVTNLLGQLTDLDEQGLRNATKATIGIADTMGMDLFGAASLVGKTIGSTTNALTRYGITVDMAGNQTERANEIMSNTAAMFQLSQDKADTFGGRLQQLKNNWGDLLETMSGAILNSRIINNLLETLSATIRDKWIPAIEEWVKSGAAEDWFDKQINNFRTFVVWIQMAIIQIGAFFKSIGDAISGSRREWASLFRTLADNPFAQKQGIADDLLQIADSLEESAKTTQTFWDNLAVSTLSQAGALGGVVGFIDQLLADPENAIIKSLPAIQTFGEEVGEAVVESVNVGVEKAARLNTRIPITDKMRQNALAMGSTTNTYGTTPTGSGLGIYFGTGGTGSLYEDFGGDPEKEESAGERAALMFSQSFGDSLAQLMLDGDGASTMEMIGAGIGNILGAEVTEQLEDSIGGIGAGIMGGLVSGLIGRIFRKKKPAEIDKPIPVKVVNWGDMTGQLLKAGARRNVSPMITTGGNIMMSSNFGREARI